MKVLRALYKAEKEKLLKELQQAEYVALTGDFWTSVATESYLGIISFIIQNIHLIAIISACAYNVYQALI